MANDTVMNVLAPTDLTSGTIPVIYSKRIYQQMMNLMLWSKFMGEEGSFMPIIRKTDLVAEPGDTINIIRTLDLTNSPVTGRLKGNEEKIQTQVIQCNPTIGRHGMAWQKLAAKRVTFPMRERSVMLLSRRWRKTLDDSVWTAFTGTGTGFSGSTPTVIWGGNATGLADIDSTDTLALDDIDRARYTLETNNAMPVGGEEGYFCLFLHTRQAYYLGISSAWRDYQKDADVRGMDNWLFTGGKPYGGIKAFGYWNGVAIFKTNQCPTTSGTGSPTTTVAKGVMVGCEALAHAIEGYEIESGEMIEGIAYADEVDDYGNEIGVGASMSWEDKIMTSESLVQLWTAANNPNA